MSRVSDAAFFAKRAVRTVKIVYSGIPARASFTQGEDWVEDANGYRTLEQKTTLLLDAVLVTELGLVERSDIDIYPVGDDAGTPTTYRVRQIQNELDGLMKRLIVAAT